MFNVVIDYLSAEDELTVALSTTSSNPVALETLLHGDDLMLFQDMVRKVYVPRNVGQYAVELVRSTRPNNPEAPDYVQKWIGWGAGLRAIQYLLLGAKVRAVFRGRYNVAIEDIRALSQPVLRHRVITNFYAESEGVTVEDIIDRLVSSIGEPVSGLA
jgi:MoxR-like ATPase